LPFQNLRAADAALVSQSPEGMKMYAFTPTSSSRFTFPLEGDLLGVDYALSSDELDGFHIVDLGADGESDAFSLNRDELGDYLGDLYPEADQVFETASPIKVTPNMMPKKNTVGVAIAQLRNALGHEDKKQKRGKRREAATNNGWTKA
jgi:hypothetical protein